MLSDLLKGKIHKDISFLDSRADNRIVLTIGYSGRALQQHFYVLDAIEQLTDKQKGKLFLLLPFTYYWENQYFLYLRERLEMMHIPYQFLTSFLPSTQLLSMRLVSDIFVEMQLRDVFAGSVREHIMAGSVVIAGNWLPYGSLSKIGVYYHSCGLDTLSQTIGKVIDYFKQEKIKCLDNTRIMSHHFSLERVCSERIDFLKSHL